MGLTGYRQSSRGHATGQQQRQDLNSGPGLCWYSLCVLVASSLWRLSWGSSEGGRSLAGAEEGRRFSSFGVFLLSEENMAVLSGN